MPKHILITGAGSYVGEAVEHWLNQYPDRYQVATIDMKQEQWKEADFRKYDVVFHVAGIAHSDTGHMTEERKQQYYQVNTRLALETAYKAKAAGVRQFIFMSSMTVYGGCRSGNRKRAAVSVITKNTKPKAANIYGNSKLQAEKGLQNIAGNDFKLVILRPPMIYGKGCKGNYQRLAKLSVRSPFFPKTANRRSMIYIENFCELVRLLIDHEEMGIFFPQNKEYVDTSEMVRQIGEIRGHKIWLIPCMSRILRWLTYCPGRLGAMIEKIVGDFVYEQELSEYQKGEYQIRTWRESVELTEKK